MQPYTKDYRSFFNNENTWATNEIHLCKVSGVNAIHSWVSHIFLQLKFRILELCYYYHTGKILKLFKGSSSTGMSRQTRLKINTFANYENPNEVVEPPPPNNKNSHSTEIQMPIVPLIALDSINCHFYSSHFDNSGLVILLSNLILLSFWEIKEIVIILLV